MHVTDGVGPLSVGVTDGFGPAVDKNVKKKSLEGLKLNFLSTNKGRKESQGTKAYRGGETQTERYSKKLKSYPSTTSTEAKTSSVTTGISSTDTRVD